MTKKNILIVLFAALLIMPVGWRIFYYLSSPDVILLLDRSDAQWITYDNDFTLEAKLPILTKSRFRYVFHIAGDVAGANIALQALKKARVFFDGTEIFFSNLPFHQWKKVHDVKIPFLVKAGSHEIMIEVTSENSYPAVMVYSDSLPVKSGKGWFASADGKHWRMAVPASRIQQAPVSKSFPSTMEAMRKVFPHLSVVFIITLLFFLLAAREGKNPIQNINARIEPAHIRWVILILWAALSVNNIFRLNFQVGADGWGHIDYIEYIVTRGSLPLAHEGWHMFQPPLSYLLSAPLYAFLVRWFDLPSVVKILTMIPVICGMLQIEIVYRSVRLVFSEKKDLQIIAVIAGSLLPIHTYATQYVGNEPLAALLMSFLVFLCFALIVPSARERQTGYFVLMGVVWGLALLSKVTALLFAPLLMIAMSIHLKLLKKPLHYFLRPTGIICIMSLLTAGWYYVRNYIMLGNAFAGVLDHLRFIQWWQDPGYRTLSHFFSFGQALLYPVYAGVTSFWDMFYSTLWLDGINSGLMDFIPWNENVMIAGALLGLLPSFFIVTSIVLFLANKRLAYKHAVLFSIVAVAVFLAAMIDMYMVCPIYSRTKASYTLGLLPCYAILIAAGAEPFLRNRYVRSVALALFTCWAFAAYAAYFVTKFQ